MTEIKQRVASIIRFVSMVSVVAALLFMYAYGTDDHVIRSESNSILPQIPKSTIFYSGLVVFAIFNLLMNWGIKVYREAQGIDSNSILFRSENQKARVIFWLTLLLAAINFLLGFFISYLGFIKIEGFDAQNDYLHLPIIGLVITIVTFIGLLIAIISKKS